MDLRKLGNRIKEQRERRKLRQADIAGALGVTTQAVSKWERGENAPDIALLVELSILLGVSVDWILGGTSVEVDTFPAAVFCTSLNGFAERAGSMRPKELAAWANVIYYAVTEALLEVDGVPIKYVGDGFLGFITGVDCCKRAIDAALSAKKRLATPDFVTVINYGDIYLGTMGHPDYSIPDILGETVNTAFLVMSWVATNLKTGIGITDSAKNNLQQDIELAERGKVSVAGRTAPVIIYEWSDIV